MLELDQNDKSSLLLILPYINRKCSSAFHSGSSAGRCELKNYVEYTVWVIAVAWQIREGFYLFCTHNDILSCWQMRAELTCALYSGWKKTKKHLHRKGVIQKAENILYMLWKQHWKIFSLVRSFSGNIFFSFAEITKKNWQNLKNVEYALLLRFKTAKINAFILMSAMWNMMWLTIFSIIVVFSTSAAPRRECANHDCDVVNTLKKTIVHLDFWWSQSPTSFLSSPLFHEPWPDNVCPLHSPLWKHQYDVFPCYFWAKPLLHCTGWHNAIDSQV